MADQATVMVVDDFSEWRLYLRTLLEVIPGFQIIADAADGLEAIDKAAHLRPDILLLDIGLPLMNGIKAAEAIRIASPDTKIIFLTQVQDEDIRMAALATGAEGYVVKSKAASELQTTIDTALQNGALPSDHESTSPRSILIPASRCPIT